MAFTVDETAKAGGLLRLALEVDVPGAGMVRLTATFPDLYPYVRPVVVARDLTLPHHQHPFGKTLCLIGRSSVNWATGDTLAWLITRQLPVALGTGVAEPAPGPERDALDEELQAEPYSDYYTYAPAAMFLIDGGWSLPADASCGDLIIGVAGLPPSEDTQQHPFGAVLEVQDRDGAILALADERLPPRFPPPVRARWSRLDAAPATDDAKAIWELAEGADDRRRSPDRAFVAQLQIRAIVFPEEIAWRSSGDGWLFVVRQPGTPSAPPLSKKQKGRGRGRSRPGGSAKYWLVRAGRAGPGDLAARVPELEGLGNCTVLIVGVGALGGTVMDQLARTGVGHLRLVDSDVLEPGNQVRHAGFFRHCGLPKVVAAARMALDRSPYVQAECTMMHLGGARPDLETSSDADTLDSLFDGINLLVDATAELGIQHLLADAAAAAGIPYLAVTATNGAWGGMVIRIRPDAEGCYTCLAHLLADGSISLPPQSANNLVQPPGCASPTFTGSGFDIDQIAMHAVRVAVGELSVGEGGYPRSPHDVAVIALRQPDGTPSLPSWSGHELTRHPSCPAH